MDMAVYVAKGLPQRGYTPCPKPFNPKDGQRVLQTLAILRDSSTPSLPKLNIQAEPLRWSVGQGWSLKRLKFQSTTPILGPLIAQFRRLWGNVAAKWLEQSIIQQQNVVNQATLDTFFLFLQQSEQQAAHIELLRRQMASQENVISILEADVAILHEQLITLVRQRGDSLNGE
jgi:hypothetical protein